MKSFLLALMLVTGSANASTTDECMSIINFINSVISMKEVGLSQNDAIDMAGNDPDKTFIIVQTYADNTHTRSQILVREMLRCNKTH